jgi:hypothetical protein
MTKAMAQSTPVSEQRKWPEDPYKGLSYYGPEDIPIFAGRTTDVQRVAHILGSGRTRVLLLHGTTGCGKSSFLRAGLIPFLENQVGRFTFAKEPTNVETALFVRSTHDPLLELASRAYEVAVSAVKTNDRERASTRESFAVTERTPIRLKRKPSEDLERTAREPVIDLDRYPVLKKFTNAVADDPERLVDLTGRIAYVRPRTQALVVDQAEEVLTLKPGHDGDAARRRFFMFLAYLSLSSINFRLIVAFRTEYHGRLYAALKAGGVDASSVEDYYLSDLTGPDLLEAITRPCSTEDVPGYGVPRAHYHFYYEDGLPEIIAADLEKTPLTSGNLPVLQLVCRRLYQRAKTLPKVRGSWVIRQKDYRDLGGIHGQIDSHLQQALEKCCETSGLGLLQVKVESMRWRDVLSELAKPQADGSITTDVKKADILSDTAKFRGCKIPFDTAMIFLAKDEWGIVRSVELTLVNTDRKLQCYSLGHDVLGSVLERWRVGRQKDRTGIRKALVFWGVAIVILSLYLRNLFPALHLSASFFSKAKIAGLILGVCVALLAAIPDSRRFRLLYRPVYGLISDFRGLRRLSGANTDDLELIRLLATRRA